MTDLPGQCPGLHEGIQRRDRVAALEVDAAEPVQRPDLSGSFAEFPPETDLASGAVTVAYVHSAEVAHSWHMALMEVIGYDLGAEGRFVRGGWLAMSYSTGGIVEARNAAVKKFLDERESEWLLWLDTDMGFPPDVIDALE